MPKVFVNYLKTDGSPDKYDCGRGRKLVGHTYSKTW